MHRIVIEDVVSRSTDNWKRERERCMTTLIETKKQGQAMKRVEENEEEESLAVLFIISMLGGVSDRPIAARFSKERRESMTIEENDIE